MSEILQKDTEEAISDSNIPWRALKNSAVLVTGATGLVGGAVIRILSAADKKYSLNINLTAHGRNKEKGGNLVRGYGVTFISSDIRYPFPETDIPPCVDYIIHAAAITKSSDMVSKPADVMTTEAQGLINTLNLAADRNCKGFVYLSSMEAYGQTDNPSASENDLGYINPASPRSSYPQSKRFCETLTVMYGRQYGIPAKAARLAQTFGAGVPKDDPRVFAQFARNAAEGKNIILHTEGKSRGNYCYITDAVRAVLTVLLKGEPNEIYNAANPAASAAIREMAETVAKKYGVSVKTEIPQNPAAKGYAPETGFIMNADKLKAIGWTPKYGLLDMYERMIADWADICPNG